MHIALLSHKSTVHTNLGNYCICAQPIRSLSPSVGHNTVLMLSQRRDARDRGCSRPFRKRFAKFQKAAYDCYVPDNPSFRDPTTLSQAGFHSAAGSIVWLPSCGTCGMPRGDPVITWNSFLVHDSHHFCLLHQLYESPKSTGAMFHCFRRRARANKANTVVAATEVTDTDADISTTKPEPNEQLVVDDHASLVSHVPLENATATSITVVISTENSLGQARAGSTRQCSTPDLAQLSSDAHAGAGSDRNSGQRGEILTRTAQASLNQGYSARAQESASQS